VEYIGFVVAALILGWAVVELNRRCFRQRRADLQPLNTWVKWDSTLADDIKESLPDEDSHEEEEDVPKSDIHIRAQQNGHYSESKKIL
jgi:hypothetical protein